MEKQYTEQEHIVAPDDDANDANNPVIKPKPKRRYKKDFICSLCQRVFHYQRDIERHLNANVICYQKHDLRSLNDMLKRNIISLPEYITEFDNNIISFNRNCNANKKWTIEDLKLVKTELQELRRKFSKLRVKVRSYYSDYDEEERNKFEEDLKVYEIQIEELMNKYLLLLI